MSQKKARKAGPAGAKQVERPPTEMEMVVGLTGYAATGATPSEIAAFAVEYKIPEAVVKTTVEGLQESAQRLQRAQQIVWPPTTGEDEEDRDG